MSFSPPWKWSGIHAYLIGPTTDKTQLETTDNDITVGEPNFFSRMTFRPLGPRVTLFASVRWVWDPCPGSCSICHAIEIDLWRCRKSCYLRLAIGLLTSLRMTLTSNRQCALLWLSRSDPWVYNRNIRKIIPETAYKKLGFWLGFTIKDWVRVPG